mmetsp:Transcript_34227/g.63874  ORF Transcript_34227/g.63874 Transcript_34227/m.63874 type:complete len:725 (+) Transcript_34227:93-2267(+)
MTSLTDKDPHLSYLLEFHDEDNQKRYQEFSMRESPLLIVFGILILTSLSGEIIMGKTDSEMSAMSVGAMWIILSPVVLGYLYLYTAWVFQSNQVVNGHSSVITSLNRFCVKYISHIGNAIILLTALSMFLQCNLDSSSQPGDSLETGSGYHNFAAVLVLLPVLFPLHSYWCNVVAVPLALAMSLMTSSTNAPHFAQLLVLLGVVLYTIDSGNKKRFLLQTELARAKTALTESQEEVERVKMATIDMHHMIGSMTHDLKTPLQAFTFELDNLKMECQELSLTPTGEELTSFKSLADENTKQLALIVSFMTMAINRSLDYTKVSTGVNLVPINSSVDIPEATSWIVSSLTHKLRNNVDVVVEPLPADVSSTILTDKQWFIENLFCLLSNAQKFTSEGEIKVRVLSPSKSVCVREAKKELLSRRSGSQVSLRRVIARSDSLKEENDKANKRDTEGLKEGERLVTMLCVEVEDSGIGLSDAQKDKLFQPFKQAQSRAGGTGLGLFSMLKRVAALGGTCGVRDRPDGQAGSIFWFKFPYVPDEVIMEDESSPMSIVRMESAHENCIKSQAEAIERRILVVDDSPLILKATKRSLEREGYIVDVASNGYECLKILNASEEQVYDLILLDVNMPIMDGLETCSRIRSQESKARQDINRAEFDDCLGVMPREKSTRSPDVPRVVIGFSGNSDCQTIAEAQAAGMNAFLSKPLSPQDLRTLSSYMPRALNESV